MPDIPAAPRDPAGQSVWSRIRELAAQFGQVQRNARLYLIANTLQSFTAGVIAVLYTLFLNGLGYGTVFIGATLFVGTAGGALGILPASALIRRLGWRAMLLWSYLVGGVAIFLQLIAPTPVVTLVTTLGVGASVAIILVLNAPFLAAHSDPERRNAIFGLNNALGFLAGVTGTLAGGFLPPLIADGFAARWPWLDALRPLLLADPQARVYQLAMLVSGLVAIPSIIPIYLMREDDTALPDALARGVASGEWVGLSERLAAWRRLAAEVARGAIGRITLSQALVGLGAGFFFPYLNIYFVTRLGASTAFYGALSAAVTASLALISLASAPLANRFGQARVIVAGQAASLPFLAAMGAVPVLGAVAVFYVVRSTLMNVGAAPLQALLMNSVPAERRVLASNTYNVAWQGLWAVGAALGGGLIAVGGYGAPFYVAAALYSSSVLLFAWWFLPRRGGRPEAEAVGQGADPAANG
ncbi:MAG TPA: MFS transporter [Ktedonobacterales bacterium]